MVIRRSIEKNQKGNLPGPVDMDSWLDDLQQGVKNKRRWKWIRGVAE
jgi:hypothetical protein